MNIDDIALEIFEAITSVNQIQPFSERGINLSNSEAYEVAKKLMCMRKWEQVGRKIGFTNRSIWPIYASRIQLASATCWLSPMNS